MLARSLRWATAALALAGLALLGTPQSAHAQLTLRASINGAADLVFVDNTPGVDADPQVGVLLLASTGPIVVAVPGGTLSVTVSQSASNARGANSVTPAPPPSTLLSQSFQIANNSPNAVTIDVRISDNNFATLPPSPTIDYQASGAGNYNTLTAANLNGATAEIRAFTSNTNVLFAGSNINGVLVPGGLTVQDSAVFAAPTGVNNFGYSDNGPFVQFAAPAGGLHSETVQQLLNIPGGVQLTGRLNSETDIGTVIPEIDPGSAASALACLGSGVLMLAGRRRKRIQA